MDNVIGYLFSLLYFSIKKRVLQKYYIHKGQSHSSFIYHAIALYYELVNLEFNDDGNKPTEDCIAQWQVDKNGKGEIVLEHPNGLIRIFTESQQSCSLQLIKGASLPLSATSYANTLCIELNANDERLHYDAITGEEYIFIAITSKLEGDTSESDARNYINGLLERVMVPARERLQRRVNLDRTKNKINLYNI